MRTRSWVVVGLFATVGVGSASGGCFGDPQTRPPDAGVDGAGGPPATFTRCVADTDCATSPARAVCGVRGVCVQCSAANRDACTGATAACDANGECVPACAKDDDCRAAGASACLDGACTQCSPTRKAACTGSTPACDPTGKCVPACTKDGDCAATPATSACHNGACTQCSPTKRSACTGSTPACDATGKCVPACTKDDECAGSPGATACLNGACAQCSPTNKAACAGSTPECAPSGKCVPACAKDDDCAATPATAACTNGACTQCSTTRKTACTGSTPACDATGKCVAACAVDSECVADPAATVCFNGACSQCSAANSAACTGTTPVCDATGKCVGLCVPACNAGTQCVAGTCVSCGTTDGAPCCGALCGLNLTCVGGTCTCGEVGTVCCGGAAGTCKPGATCVGGTCACGLTGQACCSAGAACSAGGAVCAGRKCGCLTEVYGYLTSDALVVRSDGTAHSYSGLTGSPVPVTTASGAAFVGRSFAKGAGHSCGVRTDDTVWCWGGGTLGQLGDGTLTGSPTLPVQVVTAGGAPLAGMRKVFAGASTSCAVGAAGDLWCWGKNADRQLGNGTTTNSAFAVPVQVDAGGAQVSGVEAVTIGRHMCLRKSDGTAWCWGFNQYGQVGIGSTQTFVSFPTMVATLFDTVTDISVAPDIGIGGKSTCARTTDGSVWCWGINAYGLLGNGLTTGMALAPVQVLSSAGGAPFQGAARVVVSERRACLTKTSDGSLWCWGTYGGAAPTPLFPQPWLEGGAPTAAVYFLGQGYPTASWIDVDGALHMSGSSGNETTGKVTRTIACP